MTAVTPLDEANEGHQGTLLLGATRIKQESITSCITDNVSPKNLICTANNSCGGLQSRPALRGQECQRQMLNVRNIIQNLSSFFPCQTGSVRREPLCKAPPETTWQKGKLQTKMPHLQEELFKVLKIF